MFSRGFSQICRHQQVFLDFDLLISDGNFPNSFFIICMAAQCDSPTPWSGYLLSLPYMELNITVLGSCFSATIYVISKLGGYMGYSFLASLDKNSIIAFKTTVI